jgi:hypothetical protein
VFHNGVRLVDGTDFTATNSTSITLTVAAESGDQVVVVSYASFQTSDTVSASAGGTFGGNVTVTGTVTVDGGSNGTIDFGDVTTAYGRLYADNTGTFVGSKTNQPLILRTNNTEAMRIDGGNLLVGKTSADGGIAGFEARSTGETFATSSGASLYAKRTTGDGDIIVVQGSSGTVGSIQTGAGGYMHIKGGNNTFGSGIAFNNQTWNPTNASGTITDDHVKLGDTGSRFTDLYLSGGVYLGGTGAANKLTDYETGNWNPTLINGGTVSLVTASYTKIGNFINLYLYATFTPTNSTSTFYIGNIPFVPTGNNRGGGSVSYCGNLNIQAWSAPLVSPSGYLYFHRHDANFNIINGTFFGGNATPLIISASYTTA